MSVEHKITLPRQSFRILFTQIVSVQGWAVTNKDHRASSSILNNKQVEEILDTEPPETDKKEVMKDWMSKEFEITSQRMNVMRLRNVSVNPRMTGHYQ